MAIGPLADIQTKRSDVRLWGKADMVRIENVCF
jgi:hypothetical protein